MVTNLAEMMRERLSLFRKKNKNLPERVLVYRDGVSEVCHFNFLLVLHTLTIGLHRVNS